MSVEIRTIECARCDFYQCSALRSFFAIFGYSSIMKQEKIVGLADASVARVTALPSVADCMRARLSRDSRFDGRFFIATLTTRIFCRPICPAPLSAEQNVRYFATAAAAGEAGYRSCLRCQPETALPMPESALGNAHVVRALRLIDGGFLNDQSVWRLARRLDLSARHLDRIFMQTLGATPLSIARFKRVQLARQLLATELPLTQVAAYAGYDSLSHFNRELRKFYHCAPSALRKGRGRSHAQKTLSVTLPVRPPYDFDWVFNYLQRRALGGIETVQGHCYERQLPDQQGSVVVVRDGQNLRVQLPLNSEPTHALLRRVARVFDLDADGASIHAHLAQETVLKPWVNRAPGLRVPGAWDGFETAIRAILGQQVSVARGTELANAMIQRYGHGAFPTPEQLCDQDIAEIGMPGRRGRAVSLLARAVCRGELDFSDGCDREQLSAALMAIPGIGPWTVDYIKLRVNKDPDAFPRNDWVVLKQLATTPAKAAAQAKAWQPWRAYALMYLWFAAAQRRSAGKR